MNGVAPLGDLRHIFNFYLILNFIIIIIIIIIARKLLEEYEKWGLKINLEKNYYIGCEAETKDLILGDQKDCIRGSEKYDY